MKSINHLAKSMLGRIFKSRTAYRKQQHVLVFRENTFDLFKTISAEFEALRLSESYLVWSMELGIMNVELKDSAENLFEAVMRVLRDRCAQSHFDATRFSAVPTHLVEYTGTRESNGSTEKVYSVYAFSETQKAFIKASF